MRGEPVMEQKWIRAKELAKLWGISSRRENQLCKENLLSGAIKSGKLMTTVKSSFLQGRAALERLL